MTTKTQCEWCGRVLRDTDEVAEIAIGTVTARGAFHGTAKMGRGHKKCLSRRLGGEYAVALLKEQSQSAA